MFPLRVHEFRLSSLVGVSLRSACTHDRDLDSPIRNYIQPSHNALQVYVTLIVLATGFDAA